VEGERIAITRLTMVNNRIYQVLLIGLKGKVKLSDFKKYLDSFEVLAESPAMARATPRRAGPAAPAAPAVSRARRVRQQMQKGAQARRSTPNTPAPQDNPAPDTATDDDPGPDPTKPAEVAIAYKAASGRLVDIPSEGNRSRNRNQDEFRDSAPNSGVMVGVRVGYTARGGSKVASIQPIYQVDRSYVDGERQGAPIEGETTVVAKPGYAVGGVNTRTGLLLDAFQLVFMKYNNGRLDRGDSYTSGWLGDPRGGNLKNVSANGKVVVGIHGSTNNREINSLGLVVAQ
jgi:hypothetical protein